MILPLKSFVFSCLFAAFSFAQTGLFPDAAPVIPVFAPAASAVPASLAPSPIIPAPEPLAGQDDGVEEKAPAWSQFPRYLLEDQKAIWSAPFRTGRQDAKYWAIFGGAAAGLVATDRWSSSRLPNTPGQVKAAMWTSRLGAVYTLAPATVGMWAVGKLTNNEKLKKAGYLGTEALANAAMVAMALKTVTQRQRPIEGGGAGSFFKSSGRVWNSGSSFPSSHAMETWAVASAVAHQYPDSKFVPILAYGLAGTVSASRIAARKHFASDVVVGAVIGYFIGEYVSRRHDPTRQPSWWQRVLSHVEFGAR